MMELLLGNLQKWTWHVTVEALLEKNITIYTENDIRALLAERKDEFNSSLFDYTRLFY